MPPRKLHSLGNGGNHLGDNTFRDIVKNPKSEEELDTALQFCRKNSIYIDETEVDIVRKRFRPSSINRNNIRNSVHSVPSTSTGRTSIQCSDSEKKPRNYQENVHQRKNNKNNCFKCLDCGKEYYIEKRANKFKNIPFKCLLIGRNCQTENDTKTIETCKGSKHSSDIYSTPQRESHLGNVFNCSQPSTSSTPISKEPYRCAFCSVSFDQRTRLVKHACRCKHYYQCSRCAKKYIPSSESKGQVKPPFECSDLGRVCKNNPKLNEKSSTKNLSTKFGESKIDDYLADINTLQCPNCRMFFRNLESFQNHKEGNIPKCSVRQKTNTATSNLEVVDEEDSFDSSSHGNSCLIQPGSSGEGNKIFVEAAAQESALSKKLATESLNPASPDEDDKPFESPPMDTASQSVNMKKRQRSRRDNSIQTKSLAKKPKTSAPRLKGLKSALQSEEIDEPMQPKLLRTRIQSAISPKLLETHDDGEIVQPTDCTEKLTPLSQSENLPKTLGCQTDGVPDEQGASAVLENNEKRSLRNKQRPCYLVNRYKCEKCNKSFSERRNFELHQRSHNEERPYQCLECDKTFIQAGQLKRHMHVHREKPFQCKICLKYYVREKAYIDHCKLKHNDLSVN